MACARDGVPASVGEFLPLADFRAMPLYVVDSLWLPTGMCKDGVWVSTGEEATLVCYVPPHGLAAVLRDAADVLGGARLCCVARELTKVYTCNTLSMLIRCPVLLCAMMRYYMCYYV